jgi:DNA-binding response OmpR family regulator
MTNTLKVAGYWTDFPVTYRAEQIAEIMHWLNAGESGVVIGGSGTGKSNLVGFLASRPDAVAPFSPGRPDAFCFLQLDINSLPGLTPVFFYRGLVQALQEIAEVQPALNSLIQEQVNWNDIFEVLTILHKAHRLVIEQTGKKIVWLLDRFDEGCQQLDAQTLNSLRSLRDRFKGQLCYVVFTRHPLARLRDPREIDEFHEIIAANSCWVGPMVERDARWIARQMAERLQTTFSEADVDRLIEVTGGLPAFMKLGGLALAEGVLEPHQSAQSWAEQLLRRPEFRRNCQEIWADLAVEEQNVLLALNAGANETQVDQTALAYLERSGLLRRESPAASPKFFSPILATFVAGERGSAAPGQLELDETTGQLYCGGVPLNIELTTSEHRLLAYLLAHRGEICEKDSLITIVWPNEYAGVGVSDERLAQLVARLRQKIEPDRAKPTYLQTVRGRGYRLTQPGE